LSDRFWKLIFWEKFVMGADTRSKKMYPWQPHNTFLSLFSPIHFSIKLVSVFPFLRFYLSLNSFLGRVL
jgi:hypothetical protein